MLYFVVILSSPLIEMRTFLESQLEKIWKDKEGMEYFDGVYETDVEWKLKNVNHKLFENATDYYDEA